MKKIVALLSMFLLVFAAGAASGQSAAQYYGFPIVKVFVDGKELTPSDVPPISFNNRTMVPLRMVAESLDAQVVWDQERQVVLITKNAAAIKDEPKEELVKIYDIQVRKLHENYKLVTGKIRNDNQSSITIKATINFYDLRGLLGHVHFNKDIARGEVEEFQIETKDEIEIFTRTEIIIDRLSW